MVPHHFVVIITVLIFVDGPSPFCSDHNCDDIVDVASPFSYDHNGDNICGCSLTILS